MTDPALETVVNEPDEMEAVLADYINRLAQFILVPFAVRLFRLTITAVDRFR